MTFIDFLVHVISCESLEVDPKKTNPVRNWAKPLTSTDIRCFLDLARYYRRISDGFLSIAFPLTTLTQKKVKFELLEACEKCIHEFKDKLTSAPMLILPKGNEVFVMYCDASPVVLGCVLM